MEICALLRPLPTDIPASVIEQTFRSIVSGAVTRGFGYLIISIYKHCVPFQDETGLIGATIDPILHFKYQGVLKVPSVWVLRDVTVIKAAVSSTCEPPLLLCVCCRNVQGIH